MHEGHDLWLSTPKQRSENKPTVVGHSNHLIAIDGKTECTQ
jgi:hypothetical protein